MPKISLKAARVNARLTLIEAARLLGIGKDRLIKWEKHSRLEPPVWQQKISAVYKMPLDMIYFG